MNQLGDELEEKRTAQTGLMLLERWKKSALSRKWKQSESDKSRT